MKNYHPPTIDLQQQAIEVDTRFQEENPSEIFSTHFHRRYWYIVTHKYAYLRTFATCHIIFNLGSPI